MREGMNARVVSGARELVARKDIVVMQIHTVARDGAATRVRAAVTDCATPIYGAEVRDGEA